MSVDMAWGIVVSWVVAVAVAHTIGASKGRRGEGLFLGILLGWLGVVVVLILPGKDENKPAAEDLKIKIRCSVCGGLASEAAGFCPGCGAALKVFSPDTDTKPDADPTDVEILELEAKAAAEHARAMQLKVEAIQAARVAKNAAKKIKKPPS